MRLIFSGLGSIGRLDGLALACGDAGGFGIPFFNGPSDDKDTKIARTG